MAHDEPNWLFEASRARSTAVDDWLIEPSATALAGTAVVGAE